MPNPGHNENAIRLAALAGDAQIALDKVARGEADANEGWLAYGAALNEGRALHTSENGTENDRGFGGWIKDNNLGQLGQDEVHPKEREAAMWAAANADQLAEAKATCNARTMRGWHAQWKKIEQEREAARQKAEREAEQARKRADAEAARKIAAEQEKIEAEARAAAEAAKDETKRKEAEAKAEQAAAAKADAKAVAGEIEAEITLELDAANQLEEPEDVAALRKAFRNLPREAQEDDFVNLHLNLRDRDREIASLKEEIAKRDAWWTASDGGTNRARVFAMADEQIRVATDRMKEYQAAAARLQRQVNMQKAEIARLKKEAENQVIPL